MICRYAAAQELSYSFWKLFAGITDASMLLEGFNGHAIVYSDCKLQKERRPTHGILMDGKRVRFTADVPQRSQICRGVLKPSQKGEGHYA